MIEGIYGKQISCHMCKNTVFIPVNGYGRTHSPKGWFLRQTKDMDDSPSKRAEAFAWICPRCAFFLAADAANIDVSDVNAG